MKELFDPIAIGQRLREVRGDASQTEFADQLGVTYKTISNYEIGKRVPDVEFMWLNVEFSIVPKPILYIAPPVLLFTLLNELDLI